MTTTMKWKQGYPLDFKDALNRTLSDQAITDFLASSCPPRFVYGALMLPTVLKYFLNLPQSAQIDMVPATLRGYKLYKLAKDGLPTILPSSDTKSYVEGMLVFGLDKEQRNQLYDVESGLAKFIDVEVQILQKDHLCRFEVTSTRVVDAGTFVWNSLQDALIRVETPDWPLDGFIAGQLYENIVQNQERSEDLDGLD